VEANWRIGPKKSGEWVGHSEGVNCSVSKWKVKEYKPDPEEDRGY
jgi:hypothetical protein